MLVDGGTLIPLRFIVTLLTDLTILIVLIMQLFDLPNILFPSLFVRLLILPIHLACTCLIDFNDIIYLTILAQPLRLINLVELIFLIYLIYLI
jgi:hypothetical protein